LNIPTVGHLKTLQSWMDEEHIFDVWTGQSSLFLGENDIHIRKTHHWPIHKSLAHLKALNLTYSIIMEDIQAVIDNQDKERGLSPSSKNDSAAADPWFNEYHTYESIVNQVRVWCNLKPSICTYNPVIATSVQGRQIVGVHLKGGPASSKKSAGEKKVWINGGQHAREWISIATVMYIYHQLVSLYGINPIITRYIDEIEFIIVPVVNPDGYDFTWTNNRLWRKNRRHNSGTIYGVDLNRNWNNHWGGPGSSADPNSDTYRGTSPFSEPETKGVSDYILRVAANSQLLVAIDYHAYSQLCLYPYSWTSTAPRTAAALRTGGLGIVTAIKSTPGGATYTAQGGYQLYIASGGAHDWFYDESSIPYSYTLELRDTGQYGFLLPPNQIVPTGEENWNAFVWLIEHVYFSS